jgi:photosystem II stability/assembly factor-like uncharacterized protein
MNTTTGNARLNPRARRAVLLILAAVLVTAGTGVVYLKPSLLSHPPPAKAVDPAVLSSDYAAAYFFSTPSLGWALVTETTSAASGFSVFKTTDAARHWKRQLVKQPNQMGSGPLMIQFFDPSHGVIAVGEPAEIYRTSDGGTNWTLVKTPAFFLSSFVPVDAAHGWLLGLSDSGPPAQEVPKLFVTSDGGDTWTALPGALTWANDGSLLLRNANFSFRSAREGWLGANAAEPIVYSSVDGGASWQPHALPNVVASDLCTAGPPGKQGQLSTSVSLLPGHGVVTISSDFCGHDQAYMSLDGGVAWRPLATPPGTTSRWTYAYQDSSHWWAMGGGDLWKSSDAGSSWKLVSQQLDGWGYIPHVIDANHAWAELEGPPGYEAGLALTSDGGLHWSQVSTPKPG